MTATDSPPVTHRLHLLSAWNRIVLSLFYASLYTRLMCWQVYRYRVKFVPSAFKTGPFRRPRPLFELHVVYGERTVAIRPSSKFENFGNGRVWDSAQHSNETAPRTHVHFPRSIKILFNKSCSRATKFMPLSLTLHARSMIKRWTLYRTLSAVVGG